MCTIQNQGLLEVLLPQEYLDATSNPKRAQVLNGAAYILKMGATALQDCYGKNGNDRHLRKLDALVSDTACQTRAVLNAILAKYGHNGYLSLEKIRSITGPLLQVGELLSKEAKLKEGRTLRTLLAEHENDLTLLRDVDVKILILSRLLYEARNECAPKKKELCPRCGCGQIVEDAKVATTTEDKFAHECREGARTDSPELSKHIVYTGQEQLAELSARRLMQLVQEKKLPIQSLLTEKSLREVVRNEKGRVRRELPCTGTVEAALQLAAVHKIPVLVRRRLTQHSILKSAKDGEYELEIPCRATLPEGETLARLVPTPGCLKGNSPILVIDGLHAQCVKGEPLGEDLSKMPLDKIIREMAATHPQYTDKKMSVPEELADLRAMGLADLADCVQPLAEAALKDGCARENPRNYVITHIYSCAPEELPL